MRYFLFVLIYSLSSLVYADTVYKNFDQNGRVIYSDKPIQGLKEPEQIIIKDSTDINNSENTTTEHMIRQPLPPVNIEAQRNEISIKIKEAEKELADAKLMRDRAKKEQSIKQAQCQATSTERNPPCNIDISTEESTVKNAETKLNNLQIELNKVPK